MNKHAWQACLTAMLLTSPALAENWIPVRQEEVTVREIDQDSIVRNGPVVTFTARHTFGNTQEYQVGRRGAKYLLISSRVNCKGRTLAQLGTEAMDEKMKLISRQKIHMPQDTPVSRESIDERMLEQLCAVKNSPQ